MATFTVGIPYSPQKPKNPYCRDFSLRVATLVAKIGSGFFFSWSLLSNNSMATNFQSFTTAIVSVLWHVTVEGRHLGV